MPNDTNLPDTLKAEIAQLLGIEVNKLPPRLTPDQTAKVLDVKPNTLSIWRCTGRHNLPFIKTGKTPYYRVVDVISYMARHIYSHTDTPATPEQLRPHPLIASPATEQAGRA